jgi:HAD superfamily hydrolase (TIGR01509 family)
MNDRQSTARRLQPPRPLRAVLFDLDGTLTVATLDWPLIRREIGATDRSVLEHLATLGGEEARRAWEIVEAHERRAAEMATLAHGAAQLVALLRERGVRVGVVTNNARTTTLPLLARLGVETDVLVTRDDAAGKPSPEPVLSALRLLRVDTSEALFVGDGMLDVAAGRAAGVYTVHVSDRCANGCDRHLADLDAVAGWILAT